MRKITILLALSLSLSCNKTGINIPEISGIRQPVNIEYFKTGDILLPDYACPDTLIVINAPGLNYGMGLIEQGIIDATDDQIDSILHTNCVIK